MAPSKQFDCKMVNLYCLGISTYAVILHNDKYRSRCAVLRTAGARKAAQTSGTRRMCAATAKSTRARRRQQHLWNQGLEKRLICLKSIALVAPPGHRLDPRNRRHAR